MAVKRVLTGAVCLSVLEDSFSFGQIHVALTCILAKTIAVVSKVVKEEYLAIILIFFFHFSIKIYVVGTH